LTIQFGLIGVDLALLLRLGVVLALKLITDQGAGAETQYAADRCASSGTTHGSADDAARRGASQRADSRAFFTSCEGAARTTEF
jgi:hypothetical protein